MTGASARDQLFLPYGGQVVDDDDVAAVERVLRSDWLTTGPVVREFEKAFARHLAAPYAVACSSGTAGLHLAALAAGIGPGDTVIVPSITFAASANCVRYTGADVVFADVDPTTGMMTVETFADALSRAPAPPVAVVVVDLAGQVPDFPRIAEMSSSLGMTVIEDACHALGTVYESDGQNYTVGSCAHADYCVFSFHPVKAMAMGEGGAVTCRTPSDAAQLSRFRSHGISRDAGTFANRSLAGLDDREDANPWYYELQDLGFNYRASDIHCALGLSQLKKLDVFLERRRTLMALYESALVDLAPNVRPIRRTPAVSVGWHLNVILIDFDEVGVSRRVVVDELKERGIGSQVHYIPLHLQPYYTDLYGQVTLAGAENYYDRCLSLPLSVSMVDEDVMRVVDALKAVLRLQ